MTLPKQKYETKTELRELLSNLLKNCLEISAWDSLSYNRRFSTSPCPDKPFADIFKKYRKNVFTNSIIHHFLELLLYAGSDTNPVIFKAINIIETNYPAFIVPRGFKCRNNREINDTHTNLTTSIYYSKPSSITSPVESKRTELRALR